MPVAEVFAGKFPRSCTYAVAVDGCDLLYTSNKGFADRQCKRLNAVFAGDLTDLRDLKRAVRNKIQNHFASSQAPVLLQYLEDVQAGKNMKGYQFPWSGKIPNQSMRVSAPFHIPDEAPPKHDDSIDADTYGIGQPERKSTAHWEPDTIDPEVDIMDSIRQACGR